MKYSIKLFLSILIIALTSAWSHSPNKPMPNEVLEDFFNASGGVEKWKSVKTLQVGGAYEEDGESTAFYSYYNHINSCMKYESDKIGSVNSLTEFWMKAEGRGWKDAGVALRITNRSFYSNFLMSLKKVHPTAFLLRIYTDRPQVLELAENPIVGSNNIALVLVRDEEMDSHKKNQSTYYFLFDPSTKLLNKTVQVDDVGDIIRVVSHSDYREIGGFVISHTQEAVIKKDMGVGLGLSGTLAGATKTYTYSSFKFNEEIDPKVFMVE